MHMIHSRLCCSFSWNSSSGPSSKPLSHILVQALFPSELLLISTAYLVTNNFVSLPLPHPLFKHTSVMYLLKFNSNFSQFYCPLLNPLWPHPNKCLFTFMVYPKISIVLKNLFWSPGPKGVPVKSSRFIQYFPFCSNGLLNWFASFLNAQVTSLLTAFQFSICSTMFTVLPGLHNSCLMNE